MSIIISKSVHGVIVELENWTVTSSEGTWIVVHRGRTRRSAAVAPPQEDYRIHKEERITDVLEEIPKERLDRAGKSSLIVV